VSIRRIVLAVLALLAFSGCSRRSQFLEREIKLGEHTYKYRVWLPHHYTKLHRLPVILYLHGSGERGSDNSSQLNTGLAPALERYGERYKAIVVFPQAESGREWYGETETMALAELDAAMREFHADPRRVYLTGTLLRGRFALRMCVLSFRTHASRMEMALEDVRAAVADLAEFPA